MFMSHNKKPNNFLIHITDNNSTALCNSTIRTPNWNCFEESEEIGEDKICRACAERRYKNEKYKNWTQAMFNERSRKYRESFKETAKKEREALRAIYCFTKN